MTEITAEIRKKYLSDLEKTRLQDQNVLDIKKEVKEDLHSRFSCVIGVFGSFKYQYSEGITGEEAIDYTANQVAHLNPDTIVLTGKAHYVFHNGELIKEKHLQSTLQDFIDERHITSYGYSKILASVCSYAIFFVTPAIRSTSMIEEHEFCGNGFEHNIFGLGAYILENENDENKILCECFDIEHNQNDAVSFYHCKKIVKGETHCEGTFHQINFAGLQEFTQREFFRLIATKKIGSVPQIFQALKIT